MINAALFGYSGFVGLNLMQFYKIDHFYNSKNIKDAINKEFDTIFFCSIPAVKWYANKNPEEDTEIIEGIKTILKTVKCNRFILISTIDVYDNVSGKFNETDVVIDYNNNHTYGKNRYLFELFIMQEYENYHIVRLPGLFGKGLKKNIIYDLIHNNNVGNINLQTAGPTPAFPRFFELGAVSGGRTLSGFSKENPELSAGPKGHSGLKVNNNSIFQWYDLEWLKCDIDIIINHNIKICNLFTEPIKTEEIAALFSPLLVPFVKGVGVVYDTRTQYGHLFGDSVDYIRNSATVLTALKRYLQFIGWDKSRLCVSNICVKHISQFQFAHIIKLYGFTKVQIAPTKLLDNGNWGELENIRFDNFTDIGLQIYGFQSIAYGLKELCIFNLQNNTEMPIGNSFWSLMTHIKKVIDCAIRQNVRVIVFGCPINRRIPDMPPSFIGMTNDEVFVEFFRALGRHCVKRGSDIVICIENNSKVYGCNYLNTVDECNAIVKKIGYPNIKLMVDMGNMIHENDHSTLPPNNVHYVDISNEFMMPFDGNTPVITEANQLWHQWWQSFNNQLRTSSYNGVMNLEMIIANEECELNILCKSLNNFIALTNHQTPLTAR